MLTSPIQGTAHQMCSIAVVVVTGVQIVEDAMATSHRNGGIMGIDEMRRRVCKSRGSQSADVTM